MLRATNLSSTSVVLTWETPPSEDLNGRVIGYFINVTKLRSGERLELFSNSTILTVYNLHPYTMYTYIFAAVTNAGHGPFSNALQIETLEAGKWQNLHIRIEFRQYNVGFLLIFITFVSSPIKSSSKSDINCHKC